MDITTKGKDCFTLKDRFLHALCVVRIITEAQVNEDVFKEMGIEWKDEYLDFVPLEVYATFLSHYRINARWLLVGAGPMMDIKNISFPGGNSSTVFVINSINHSTLGDVFINQEVSKSNIG